MSRTLMVWLILLVAVQGLASAESAGVRVSSPVWAIPVLAESDSGRIRRAPGNLHRSGDCAIWFPLQISGTRQPSRSVAPTPARIRLPHSAALSNLRTILRAMDQSKGVI
jgi:hypothetical protein